MEEKHPVRLRLPPLYRGEYNEDNVHYNSPLSEGCDFSRGVFKSSQSNSNHKENQKGVFKKYKNMPYNPKLKEKARKL